MEKVGAVNRFSKFHDTSPSRYKNDIEWNQNRNEFVIWKNTKLFKEFPPLLKLFDVYTRFDGNFGVQDKDFIRAINYYEHKYCIWIQEVYTKYGEKCSECCCFEK